MRFIKKLFEKISKTKNKTPLGRWGIKTNDKTKHAMFQSADHCGDNICGKPSIAKEIINNSHQS